MPHNPHPDFSYILDEHYPEVFGEGCELRLYPIANKGDRWCGNVELRLNINHNNNIKEHKASIVTHQNFLDSKNNKRFICLMNHLQSVAEHWEKTNE